VNWLGESRTAEQEASKAVQTGRTEGGGVAEETSEEVVIEAPRELCWQIVTDFERYPEWVPDLRSVDVRERDGEGRPKVVAFRAAAFGRSTSYTLSYDLSGAPERLSWVEVEGDITDRLDGSYELEESSGGRTTVVYRLAAELKVPLPAFVKRRAEGRIVSSALRQLKARAETLAHNGAVSKG